jgi:NADPH:quinone reductase
MKAVVTELAATPDEAIDRIVLEPMEMPGAGPNDVVVEVKSASVGWVDLLMTSGQYQHVPKPPYTPGLEYAGIEVSTGRRVMVDGFIAGPRSLGDYQRWGGWAKYAIAPRDAILDIPGDLDFDQACNLLGNYETAYHCLIARGHLTAGETVLILGASGATGLAAVHLAKIMGAKVIAVGRSPEKLAIVKEQGADHVVTTDKLRDAVKAIGDVDVVYDAVGGPLSTEALRCLKFGGRFLIVGWAGTPLAGRKENPNVLPTNLIMMKGVDVLGCPAVISVVKNPALRPPRLAQVLGWAREGKIKPHVSHRFPLAQLKDAMRAKWTGAVVGGCVVHP